MPGKVVSKEEWLAARKAFLADEKAHMQAGDKLAAARRALPMTKVTKEYTFTTLAGGDNDSTTPTTQVTLRDLFDGKKQLLVYHFMFAPEDAQGCQGCSFVGTHVPHPGHLGARDTRLVCVSRAPADKLEGFKRRNGWTFPWYSSGEGDFNYDFQATLDEARGGSGAAADGAGGEEEPRGGGDALFNFKTNAERVAQGKTPLAKGDYPGMSVFLMGDDGEVYHTYSTYERGLEGMLSTFQLLDLTPLGRQDKEYGPGSFQYQYQYEEQV